MRSDEPQNNNSQQGESVEFVPLAPLLENPDPDFDVVVAQRNREAPGRIEPAKEENRPAPANRKGKLP